MWYKRKPPDLSITEWYKPLAVGDKVRITNIHGRPYGTVIEISRKITMTQVCLIRYGDKMRWCFREELRKVIDNESIHHFG